MLNTKELEKFDKEVVSHVCELIFNERIGDIDEIKNAVWYKFHDEEKERQVDDIAYCLLQNGFITYINTLYSSSKQSIMACDSNDYNLIKEGYLRR
ncbi:hypothetical protein LOY18_12010 [Staphylococcus capitis]|uniref:hypothetical protein n=1 Tax=Staphylococcus capitis TaxID=29388 RepID=UPI001E58864D|nr:hypothetical protein [Staphylococcus capitis]MCC9117506.1 hypothetical protein [Staphylococcus capitis]MCC9143968.1 hypothetical protein [Staphylococcus capitis]